jgi:hypothetical protein
VLFYFLLDFLNKNIPVASKTMPRNIKNTWDAGLLPEKEKHPQSY